MNYFIYLALCILQPICLPFPEAVTYLFGLETIGPHLSLVMGVLGTVTGIFSAYTLSRRLGERYTEKLGAKKGINLYKRIVKKNEVLITGLLFVIPVIPDEAICIGAGLIGIQRGILLLTAFFSKIVSISMVVYSDFIADLFGTNRWIILAIELILLYILAYIYKKIQLKKNCVNE